MDLSTIDWSGLLAQYGPTVLTSTLTSSTISGVFSEYLKLKTTIKIKRQEELDKRVFQKLDELHLLDRDITFLELYKEGNFAKIIKKAEEYYPSHKNLNEISFKLDYFDKFFESASMVSDEDMQLIWAKILAGEAVEPGKYSFRFLEMLRNLTKEEAEVFLKASRLIVNDGESYFLCIQEDDNTYFYEKYNLYFSDFELLSECGLINTSSRVLNISKFDEEESSWLANKNEVLHITNLQDNFKIYNYPLTRMGIQLLNLIEEETSTEFIVDLGRYYQELLSEKSANVAIHPIVGYDEEEDTLLLDFGVNLLEKRASKAL